MIRPAKDEEIRACLEDPTVSIRLASIPRHFGNTHNYIVSLMNKEMFFCYKKESKYVAEVHIAAIKEHRLLAREMAKLIISFMKDKRFKKITTWVPEIYKSTINFAKKMGFEEYKRLYNGAYNCYAVYLQRAI